MPPEMLEKLVDLLRQMGQVINNAALYGPAHKITSRSMHDCFASLVQLLESWPRINLSIVEGDLLVEGKPAGLKNPFVNILAGKLSELEISGFSLLRGMSKEEFYNLMELLITAKPAEGAGFADAVTQRGLQHVHAERVKYARVTEGAVVVEEEDAAAAEAAAAAGVAVEQIMAFLKGDVGVKAEQIASGLHKVSSDADQLAGLIMEAAAVRQRPGGVDGGESLADIVVGCLRRTFTGLMKDPTAKSITGKKNIKKTMLVLEKTVLDKLHAISGEDPEADAAIDAAIEEMIDDLEIDQLSSEYAKRRKALEKTESRVMRYIKAHEGEQEAEVNLQEKLAEAGVTPDGWRELVVKTRKEPMATGRGEMDQGIAGVGVLAVLLNELDDMMASMPDPRALGQKVAQLGDRVNDLADGTEQKIEKLDEKMKAEDEALAGIGETEKSKAKLSRKALMELLAEIVQELCQSLSAINCAVGMTLAGHIGDLNDEQREVLGVASNCARRLDQLLERLFEIVGLPTSLTPKKDIVYSRPPT
ncbi:MAG: hypothetical protein JXB04_01795 [Kiritimatiellae bacterium]|nr:hypothetical protein [Kiritimatiellia bacterium]